MISKILHTIKWINCDRRKIKNSKKMRLHTKHGVKKVRHKLINTKPKSKI